MYYIMNIDASTVSEEVRYFDGVSSLMTRYDYVFNPRDHINLTPLALRADNGDRNVNSRYIVMNQTTTNDLFFEYNMGFGKLVINDYRVKDYRIQRVKGENIHPKSSSLNKSKPRSK